MIFGERSADRKKAKERKGEIKQMKKEFLAVGCEKNRVSESLREFDEILELGGTLQEEYRVSKEHLEEARRAIIRLLDCMGESPEPEVRESLKALVEELDQVYHDCSIRADDLDFVSTMQNLKQMMADKNSMTGMSAIMLRSELENIKAVLDDAAGWKAPDFMALAYYFLQEGRDGIKEMENEQRNAYVFSYFREHFMDVFEEECKKANLIQKVCELERIYVYGEA